MRPALTLMLPAGPITPLSNPPPRIRRPRSPHPQALVSVARRDRPPSRGACATPPPPAPDDQDGIGEPMMFEMSPIVASRGIESLATHHHHLPRSSAAVPVPVPLPMRSRPAPLFAAYEPPRRAPPVAVSPPMEGAVLDPVPALRAHKHQNRVATFSSAGIGIGGGLPPLQAPANIAPPPPLPPLNVRAVSSPYPAASASKPPSFRYPLPNFFRRHTGGAATAPLAIREEAPQLQHESEEPELPDLVHHSARCVQCSVSGVHDHHAHARVATHASARRSSTPDAFKLEMLATQLQLASSSEDDTPITPEQAVADDDEDDEDYAEADTTVRAHQASRGRNRSRRPLGRRSALFALAMPTQMSELVLTSPSSSGGNDADRDYDLSDTERERVPRGLRRRSR